MNFSKYQNLHNLYQTQVDIFPDHRDFLDKRIGEAQLNDLQLLEQLAEQVCAIAVNETTLRQFCEDYKWLTGIFIEEEFYFRRNGKYRLSTFAQAEEKIYANKEYMASYMNGLLISQVWWDNHTQGIASLCNLFLPGNKEGYSHLEIGPGHGLLLYQAAKDPRCGDLTAWDVSPASIENVDSALMAMGVSKRVDLKLCDMFAGPYGHFDSIVFCEVLEHLENPREALKTLHDLLTSDGRIFIKAPVNTPAPDHLYLFNNPEEIIDMVKESGFQIVDTLFAPSVGSTLERARKLKLGISTTVIATK